MTVIPASASTFSARRERWVRHAPAFVVAASVMLLAASWVAFLAIPSVYQAESVVLAPSGGAPRNYVTEMTLSSVLESAAQRLQLLSPDASSSERQAAAERLLAGLSVSPATTPSGDTEIHVVSRGGNPARAAAIANAVVQVFAAECESRNRATSQKIDALSKDVSRLAAALEEATPAAQSARAALKDFETRSAEAMLDAGSDPDAALKALVDEEKKTASDYDKTQAEVAGLENAEKLLRARLAEVPAVVESQEVTTVRNPELVATEREVRQMEKQLDELLRMYTFKHPEVIALQTDLLLKKRLLRQLQERVEDSVKSSKTPNPEYAVLKGKLDDTVVKLQVARSALAPIASRRQELSARAETLRAFIEPHRRLAARVAETDQRLQDTETQLMKKREELKSAQAMLEAVATVVRAAETPKSAAGPRRGIYAFFAVALALGAGWAALSAAHRLSPRFAGPAAVEEMAGAPVAGVVHAAAGTEAESAGQSRRRVVLSVTLGAAALALILTLVMAVLSGR